MCPADTGELTTALRRSADSSEVPAPVAAPFVPEHLGTLRVAKNLGRKHPDQSMEFTMLTVNALLRDASARLERPTRHVPQIGISRSIGSTGIMDTGSHAKPNNRPKSLQKASKIPKSKRYAICSGTNALTVPQCNGMAR